jgi:purine-binding chemotaxis protein CheW
MTSPTTDTRRALVTCAAAGELFALDVATVERVLRYTAPRHLPNAAPWMVGVIAVGERLVPVLNLRERMGLPTAEPAASARIVVLTLGDGPIGFVVDAVHEVVSLDTSAVEETPAVYRGLAKEFVRGIVRREEKLYILLAADRLVTSQERLALRAATQEKTDGR